MIKALLIPVVMFGGIAGTHLATVNAYALAGHGTAFGDSAEIQEDDPQWDCRTMGDRRCGPTNVQGVTAGCYADTGELVAVWPCRVVVNADGSSDVYTDDER